MLRSLPLLVYSLATPTCSNHSSTLLWDLCSQSEESGCVARGGTQYKSGYRDVPQTWVAKSGRQVHQWVPFFSKTWYFDGSIFQNFLKFAPKWRKFGTLIGQLFKIFRNLRQNGANFSEKFWFLVHGWVTFPSKWVHGWVAFQKSQRHPYPDQSWVPPPGCVDTSFHS